MSGFRTAFSVLTSGIKTNILFFTKGKPTKEVWYFEHPYPPGVKSYNKTKPIRIEEFDLEKAWWNNREENEYAWRVSADDLFANGLNLDQKNPNKKDEAHRDPTELLGEYQNLLAEIDTTRDALKSELMNALQKSEKAGM